MIAHLALCSMGSHFLGGNLLEAAPQWQEGPVEKMGKIRGVTWRFVQEAT